MESVASHSHTSIVSVDTYVAMKEGVQVPIAALTQLQIRFINISQIQVSLTQHKMAYLSKMPIINMNQISPILILPLHAQVQIRHIVAVNVGKVSRKEDISFSMVLYILVHGHMLVLPVRDLLTGVNLLRDMRKFMRINLIAVQLVIAALERVPHCLTMLPLAHVANQVGDRVREAAMAVQ